MIDSFYTPPELAQIMVDVIPRRVSPATIADFASGKGALLRVAEARWPKATILANDADARVAAKLRHTNPGWLISCSDFLCDPSVRTSRINAFRKKVDLALINPPFSQRGIKPISWSDGDIELRAGLATVFVLRALAFLSNRGVLVAVLPDGCLTSIRDSHAWGHIRNRYHVEILRDNNRSSFHGVSARTSLVRIALADEGFAAEKNACSTDRLIGLVRGRCQMHVLHKYRSKAGVPLVHSSQLLDGKVDLERPEKILFPQKIRGPAVLFPRVGQVTPGKVSILQSNVEVVLSDCVLGLTCRDERHARTIRQQLLNSWPDFVAQYRGTGAPYITLDRASHILSAILSVDPKHFESLPVML